MNELKPCPNVLCNSDSIELTSRYLQRQRFAYWICCTNCDASTPEFITKQEAIDFWHNRPENKHEKILNELKKILININRATINHVYEGHFKDDGCRYGMDMAAYIEDDIDRLEKELKDE